MFTKIIAIFLLVLAGTVVAGWLFIKKKTKIWFTAAFLVILYGAAVLCFLLPQTRAYLNIPNGIPEDTVSYYCDAISQQEFTLASKKVRNHGFTLDEETSTDPVAAEMMKVILRNIRLEQAVRLLKEQKVNVTQVAYAVGFSNVAHFSTVFRKQFGVSPSVYIEQHQSSETN